MGAETSSPGQNEDEKHAVNCAKPFARGRGLPKKALCSLVPALVANQRDGNSTLMWFVSGHTDDLTICALQVFVIRLYILPFPVEQLDDGCVFFVREEDGIVVEVDCRRIRIVPSYVPGPFHVYVTF